MFFFFFFGALKDVNRRLLGTSKKVGACFGRYSLGTAYYVSWKEPNGGVLCTALDVCFPFCFPLQIATAICFQFYDLHFLVHQVVHLDEQTHYVATNWAQQRVLVKLHLPLVCLQKVKSHSRQPSL